MTTKEIDTKKIDSIKLPNSFKNGKVFVFQTKDTLIVKKNRMGDFSSVRNRLKKVKNKISQKDIELAVKKARVI